MLALNLEFQEEYKRLDRLCKDYLSSSEGVSEYIRQMDAMPRIDRQYVITWEEDYKQLKHVRWVRNQLAHEVGILNSDICSDDDLNWVQSFYDRIMAGCDPFTVIRKEKEKKVIKIKKEESGINPIVPEYSNQTHQKLSLWGRIVAKIKKLFS